MGEEASSANKFMWPFDFPPYGIQESFMHNLYDTLEKGDVGIFESPTGTGKSLSMICSALHWLKENRGKSLSTCSTALPTTTTSPISNKSAPSWISDYRAKKLEEKLSVAAQKQLERQERVKLLERTGGFRNSKTSSSVRRKKRVKKAHVADVNSDEEFAPDADFNPRRKTYYSSEEDGYEDDENDTNNENLSGRLRKIYFCSRTHSQLSQFMNEIAQTPFGKSIPCVALGSRKQLCTNNAVRGLGSVSRMNDRCLDLVDLAKKDKTIQKRRGASKYLEGSHLPARSACSLYDKTSIVRLKDHVLHQAQDIETVAELATKNRCCGYYVSRASLRDAEVVCLPYSMLLHKTTRDSLGIDLKGSIVICDEAHNVIDAINDIHSSIVSLQNLNQAHYELTEYRNRYRARLKPENKVHVSNLLCLVHRLCEYLGKQANKKETVVLNAGAITMNANVDHINLFEVLEYLERTNLCKKLGGFAHKYLSSKNGSVDLHHKNKVRRASASSLHPVQAFLKGITNTDKDGRVVIEFNGQANTKIKFMLLNPGVYFKTVVDEAHAVVLAGGTMQPTSDVERQLFAHVPREKIHLFSCGHVIPEQNMLCCCLPSGPTNKSFELTFENRSKPETMEEIGRSLFNICNVVPSGVVVFFPSYGYTKQIIAQWTRSGTWTKLGKRKRVFLESQTACDTEKMLEEYAVACKDGKGALLFSVVGGKLSEGINFKDELARCVVMVGLPYPNPNDAELKAKMAYLDQKHRGSAGKEYYENQCMKAVNQCIGRAIRHRHDYSTIVLLDSRYMRSNVKAKLPKWIAQTMPNELLRFPKVFSKLNAFFVSKKKT